ncbi:MAG: exodeoxyribonuclease VII small subunit [Pseudomonadota bacterium]
MSKASETNGAQNDIAEKSFEHALEELEQIVRKLESGEGGLEQSISDYERGALLKAHCEAKLREARMRVEKIAERAGGLTTEPLDVD